MVLLRYYTRICPVELEKTIKNWILDDQFPCLQNMSLEHYHYVSQLGYKFPTLAWDIGVWK
jgi:hypothetical protein